MSRSKFAILIVAGLLSTTLLVPAAYATPTITRSLPTGDSLYAITCDNSASNGQLLSVNTTTWAKTAVGSGTTNPNAVGCAGGGTYNPVSKQSFWYNWVYSAPNRSELFTIDVATGVSTYVGQLTPGPTTGGAPEGGEIFVWGITTTTAGNMYAFWTGSFTSHHYYVGLVNQANGSITQVQQVDPAYDSYFVSEGVFNFAFNPIDSKFYTAGQIPRVDTNFTRLYSIDVATGSVTSDVASGDANASFNGMAFDSNGYMWGTNTSLYSATVNGWSTPGDLQLFSVSVPPDFYTEALILITASNNNAAAAEAARVAAAAEAARVAAAAEAARVAAAAEAAKKAKEQKELTELLSIIPSIAGLALNLGELTNSLLTTKCVKGKTVKYVKKGSKCPKRYIKK